ncbi:MAG: Stp1/IreP family PP2C-type Ser/Thr phosphatase [Anaerolineae bacterium]
MSVPIQNGYVLSIAALTDVGKSRGHNEDYVGYYQPPDEQARRSQGSLFLVCDGVGGGSAGEVASEHAARRILSDYYQAGEQGAAQERLLAAIQRANSDIYEENLRRGEDRKMATTVVAALVLGNQTLLAHAGDSRAYLVRDGQAFQVTQDHSWVAEMVQSGDLTAQEAESHPWRNRITRSLGMAESVKVDSKTIEVKPGDTLLLCSDGLTRYVSDVEIAETVSKLPAPQAAQQLIDLANARGGSDNISAVIVELLPEIVARQRQVSAPDSGQALTVAASERAQATLPTRADLEQAPTIRLAAPMAPPARHYGLFLLLGVSAIFLLLVVGLAATRNLWWPKQAQATATLSPSPTPVPVTSTGTPTTMPPTSTPELVPTATEAPSLLPTALLPLATLLTEIAPTGEATAVPVATDSGTFGTPPTPAAMPTSPIKGQVIAGIGVKLRLGPSTSAELIVILSPGETFEVRSWTKQLPDLCQSGLWLEAALPEQNLQGWVCGDSNLVQINGLAASEQRLQELNVPTAVPEEATPTIVSTLTPVPTGSVKFLPTPVFKLALGHVRVACRFA